MAVHGDGVRHQSADKVVVSVSAAIHRDIRLGSHNGPNEFAIATEVQPGCRRREIELAINRETILVDYSVAGDCIRVPSGVYCDTRALGDLEHVVASHGKALR